MPGKLPSRESSGLNNRAASCRGTGTKKRQGPSALAFGYPSRFSGFTFTRVFALQLPVRKTVGFRTPEPFSLLPSRSADPSSGFVVNNHLDCSVRLFPEHLAPRDIISIKSCAVIYLAVFEHDEHTYTRSILIPNCLESFRLHWRLIMEIRTAWTGTTPQLHGFETPRFTRKNSVSIRRSSG